jgi:TP901 family phage tail tape measure protein
MAEMQALFGSIRATTRESAATIGTALRTITARMQRLETIETFKNIGIDLHNAQGEFIGLYESINLVSEAMENMSPRDPRMAQVVEAMGGVRQMSKVIPLLSQREARQRMYNVALNETESLEEDAELRLESIAVKLARVGENLNKLMREFTEDRAIQRFADVMLNVANGAIEIGRNIRPILPMVAALGAVKVM